MTIKRAAELKPGDRVRLGFDEVRVVEKVEFHDGPVDMHGAMAVRVRWVNRQVTSLIAAVKELEIES